MANISSGVLVESPGIIVFSVEVIEVLSVSGTPSNKKRSALFPA
jgi:hypothetical protein